VRVFETIFGIITFFNPIRQVLFILRMAVDVIYNLIPTINTGAPQQSAFMECDNALYQYLGNGNVC